jgi:hypothetical protein
MSYTPTALGYTLNIKTPVGTQKVTIPLEQLASSAAHAAMNAAWPAVEQKVLSSVPALLDTVVSRAKKELPVFMDTAFARAKPPLHQEEQKLMKEIDEKAEEILNEATKRAVMIAGGLSVVIIGSAWWAGRKR